MGIGGLDTAHALLMRGTIGVGIPHNIKGKTSPYTRLAERIGSGRFLQKILPLRGSILQAGTCQILSLAENPRWSRVWQYSTKMASQAVSK